MPTALPRPFPALLLLLLLLLPAAATRGQHRMGDLGVGGQLGSPSGVTLKIYQRPDFAYDFLAAWDLDEFFFLNAHGLFERPLRDTQAQYYLGPGLVLGIDEDRKGHGELVFGISGNFGLNYFVDRFELYVQLTPRLNLIPDTDGHLGGGVGVRYYF